MGFPFPKSSRLTSPDEFRHVRQGGKQKTGRYLLLNSHVSSTTQKGPRLGITASRRFGKAHLRNRFKRIAREAFRLSKDALPRNIEIELIPKKEAQAASMQELQRELLFLLNKI